MSAQLAEKFLALVEDLRLNQKRSPWAKAQEVSGWTKQLAGEVAEVTECIDAGSPEILHLDEELGDVLWTWISTVVALEELRGPLMERIIADTQAKLRHRKPWVFDPNATLPSTPEEENAIYLRLKSLR